MLGLKAKGFLAISLVSLALGTISLAMVPAPQDGVPQDAAAQILPVVNPQRPAGHLPEQRYVTPAAEDRAPWRRKVEVRELAAESVAAVAVIETPKVEKTEASAIEDARPREPARQAARPIRDRPAREVPAARKSDVLGFYPYDR